MPRASTAVDGFVIGSTQPAQKSTYSDLGLTSSSGLSPWPGQHVAVAPAALSLRQWEQLEQNVWLRRSLPLRLQILSPCTQHQLSCRTFPGSAWSASQGSLGQDQIAFAQSSRCRKTLSSSSASSRADLLWSQERPSWCCQLDALEIHCSPAEVHGVN